VTPALELSDQAGPASTPHADTWIRRTFPATFLRPRPQLFDWPCPRRRLYPPRFLHHRMPARLDPPPISLRSPAPVDLPLRRRKTAPCLLLRFIGPNRVRRRTFQSRGPLPCSTDRSPCLRQSCETSPSRAPPWSSASSWKLVSSFASLPVSQPAEQTHKDVRVERARHVSTDRAGLHCIPPRRPEPAAAADLVHNQRLAPAHAPVACCSSPSLH